jgi:hypothetical protein
MGGAVLGAQWLLAGPAEAIAARLGRSWVYSAVTVLGAVVAGAGAYLLAALLLGCDELAELLGRAPAPKAQATMEHEEAEHTDA